MKTKHERVFKPEINTVVISHPSESHAFLTRHDGTATGTSCGIG